MVIMHHRRNQAMIHQQLLVQICQQDIRQNQKADKKHQEKLRQNRLQKHHAKKDINEEKNEDKAAWNHNHLNQVEGQEKEGHFLQQEQIKT